MAANQSDTVVVIGGGISGITVAVEAAETGAYVTLIEKEPFIGGRVYRMHQYFPKLCSPLCGMEINFRRIKSNPNIKVITGAQVEEITGSRGNFGLKVKVGARLVNDNCTACNRCVDVCPVERENDFNYSMDKTKAVYIPHPMAYPSIYAIDETVCKGKECAKCVEECKYGAIKLDAKETTIDLKAGSVVYATGWKPYDAAKIDNLGFGKMPNVINNVMMERLAAPEGPTKGKIVRPSDGKEVKDIVFVQCAGSRDENHLPYCSAICCLASLKQATYVRNANPESKVTIFYIDIRTPGKYETFYNSVAKDENITLVKGKVAKISEDKATGDVLVTAEDIYGGGKKEQRADMVVLATGMVPSVNGEMNGSPAITGEHGFLSAELQPDGIYSVGVARQPANVTSSLLDATGTALKTIQGIDR